MTSINAAKVCSFVIVALAILFILGSIACAVAAMAHQQWMYYTITKTDGRCTDPSNNLYCFSRSRGMFKQCLEPVPDDAKIGSTLRGFKNGNCFEIEMGQKGSTNQEILNIRRSFVGVYAAGLLCALLGLLVAIVAVILLCCTSRGPNSFPILAMILAFIMLLGGLCYLVGMLIFHIMLDEEKKQLSGDAQWKYGQWTYDIILATQSSYRISYILAWVACICAFIAGILTLLSLCCCARVYQRSSSSSPNAAGSKSRTKSRKTKTVTESSHENAAYSEPDYVVVKHAVHSEAPKPIPVESAPTLPAGNHPSRYNTDTNDDGFYYNAEVSAGNKNMYRIY